MTKQDLQKELKEAMLSKNANRTSTIRMLISAIGYFEIQKGAGYEASDADVESVVQKEAKKIKDSIEQYKAAGRNDLVEKETAELSVLEKYLPVQMSEDEIRKLVGEAISQTKATTQADMGKVMGALIPKTKGKADGAIISKIVLEKLSE